MSSIEGGEGFAARRMISEAQIVCDPNGNRLTAAAVFAGKGQS